MSRLSSNERHPAQHAATLPCVDAQRTFGRIQAPNECIQTRHESFLAAHVGGLSTDYLLHAGGSAVLPRMRADSPRMYAVSARMYGLMPHATGYIPRVKGYKARMNAVVARDTACMPRLYGFIARTSPAVLACVPTDGACNQSLDPCMPSCGVCVDSDEATLHSLGACKPAFAEADPDDALIAASSRTIQPDREANPWMRFIRGWLALWDAMQSTSMRASQDHPSPYSTPNSAATRV